MELLDRLIIAVIRSQQYIPTGQWHDECPHIKLYITMCKIVSNVASAALMTALLLVTWLHDTLDYVQVIFLVYVVVHFVCLICGLCSLQLLVPRWFSWLRHVLCSLGCGLFWLSTSGIQLGLDDTCTVVSTAHTSTMDDLVSVYFRLCGGAYAFSNFGWLRTHRLKVTLPVGNGCTVLLSCCLPSLEIPIVQLPDMTYSTMYPTWAMTHNDEHGMTSLSVNT
jgi:hypothetical protein